jgi:hypothetical protein
LGRFFSFTPREPFRPEAEPLAGLSGVSGPLVLEGFRRRVDECRRAGCGGHDHHDQPPHRDQFALRTRSAPDKPTRIDKLVIGAVNGTAR